ncbi:MAG: hypothetical protein QM796_06475 [Chthoniobacteraceae bacterium]
MLKCTPVGGNRNWAYPPYSADTASDNAMSAGWMDVSNSVTVSIRDGTNSGVCVISPDSTGKQFFPNQLGWYPGGWTTVAYGDPHFRPGMLSQNNVNTAVNGVPLGGAGDTPQNYSFLTWTGDTSPQYYADADGVVRRAMGGLVGSSASTKVGFPMAWANGGGNARTDQSNSRPMILNRPFRSTGELAYTFSGTPWKNINFSMPESGDGALLDAFCVQDTNDPGTLIAGRVNLNTRQTPVLQAIIAGAYEDEWNATTTALPAGSGAIAANAANALVKRTMDTTTKGKGPLRNVSELVGKWIGETDASGGGIDGSKSYDGFSADLWNAITSTGVLSSGTDQEKYIGRYQSAAVRALANCGQTRVWNLMIDVVAQTGRYPMNAASINPSNPLAAFIVEGEQRYWVHVAIDRYTGEVIDKQIETIKE